jgi:TM2 domain-containing membrane protein YozV
MTVAPRSPALGAILGLLIPGLGCMVNGRPGFGVLILALWIVSLPLVIIFVGWVLVPAVWIWSGVMGHAAARDWNRRHGIIS